MFLEFFSDALDGYESFVGHGRRGGIAAAAAAAGSSRDAGSPPAAPGAPAASQPQQLRARPSAAPATGLGPAPPGGAALAALGRVSVGSCCSRVTGASGASNLMVNVRGLLAHHDERGW
jgi:hypothetical protein